ncbi:hypothetical protein [Kocuria sp. SM24M-10]|uniref:hypothetical protein n=1 Tax=Kocuria sp. SM24M-10 TaxID=1660349 RepID=UPI00064AD595|nr:hypothetical protein [Kocuria sp. SM24M-10]KLU10874.1 hypothetical protein ABL57_04295 [Kocuria sp. SM24M-10]
MAYERSKAVVLRAVPKGCRLARHVVAWKRAVLEHPALELMRADGRANMAALVEVIAVQQDPASQTWRTTWGWVAERLGVHEDSIGRMIRRLKDWGLLAVVATGRSARYTPRSTGKKQGEAPVYALIVPAPPKPAPTPAENTPEEAAEAVDINVGPVPPKGVCPPPHARESLPRKDAATPRPSAKAAAQRLEVQAALAQRTNPLWPAHATVRPLSVEAARSNWKQAYRCAGLELQHHALVLRRITTAYVVSVAKTHFQAGWTIADVLHALDWAPNGQRYTHDALTGIEHPGAWFAARLRAWTHQDGTPHRSPDQRAAAEAEQRRAEAVAAAARYAARQEAAAAAPEGAGAGGVAVRPADELSAARRPLKERFAAAYAAGVAEAARRAGAPGTQ